ncbi:MAG: hypothetical protein GY828_03170 [Candidatus Gracilibacteria bacterium]|nr:hypothetical protein [Candidatus Gracilibacteria bacterium]
MNNSKVSELDRFTGGRVLVDVLNTRNYKSLIEGNIKVNNIKHINDYRELELDINSIPVYLDAEIRAHVIKERESKFSIAKKHEREKTI